MSLLSAVGATGEASQGGLLAKLIEESMLRGPRASKDVLGPSLHPCRRCFNVHVLDACKALPAVDGYRAVLANLAITIRANWQGTIDQSDTEFLHDLRIAVRRTRTVLGEAKGVLGHADVGEDPVEVLEAALHRLPERHAVAHSLGEINRDDLGVALGLEAVAGALQPSAPVVEVGQLTVVDDGHVGEWIGPVGVGVGDVDVGLGRHPDVPDRLRA